jgi:hypothetical protein
VSIVRFSELLDEKIEYPFDESANFPQFPKTNHPRKAPFWIKLLFDLYFLPLKIAAIVIAIVIIKVFIFKPCADPV